MCWARSGELYIGLAGAETLVLLCNHLVVQTSMGRWPPAILVLLRR